MLNFFKQLRTAFMQQYAPSEQQEDSLVFVGEIPEGSFLTQGELQILQKVLAENIRQEEQDRSCLLESAKLYKSLQKEVPTRQMFKEHRKIKAKIAKLAAIQKKLKHSLLTMK